MSDIEEYIYKLTDPFTNKIHWVGRTTDPEGRFLSHIASKAENSEKDAWIAGLRERDAFPIMEIIEKVISEHPLEREKYWIQFYLRQGAPLLNKAHNKKFPIIGYDQEQHKHQQQTAWLKRMLKTMPAEASPLDRLVFITLFALCHGEERPQKIQIGKIVELTGASYHGLTDSNDRAEGSFPRLHRLGLITYDRKNKHTTTITIHATLIREGMTS